MKVLVVSLLRLGDVLLHRELARSIQRQYPGCEIHFLINSQFQSVEALLPEVDRWHLMDRKAIQRILVEREQSPLTAFSLLESMVSEINKENFDIIFNATHNRFSVRLMDLFTAKEKRGVAFEMGRKVPESNRWQTYLNENFSELQGSRFHYLEVLQKSLGLEMALPESAEMRKPGMILLQLLTSDPKKNWGLNRFHELKSKIESAFPNHRVLGLCSPQEKEQVEKVFHWNEFLTPTLVEARELMKEARLVITGDTSIQHLATQHNCPVVSLFLGSADPQKTSPWQNGAWVIQGQAACAPCGHSSPCHQAEHLCAQSLSVQTVFDLVSGLLQQQPIRISAKNPAFQMQESGKSFLAQLQGYELEMQIEHAVWNSYLNGARPEFLDETSVNPEEVAALKLEHSRFQTAIQELIENKTDIETVESEFPLWKDSLIRYKRDAKAIDEVKELIQIRSEVLSCLGTQKEVSHVGNSKHNAQEYFAEA